MQHDTVIFLFFADSLSMNRKSFELIVLMLTILMLAGCSSNKEASSSPMNADPSIFESGIASYYAEKYHGRRTASGEIFNMNNLTAAHRTLKFGTVVEVENLSNGRRVNVKINDRGPFAEGRVIDLSKRAASELGMINAGLAEVVIRIVSYP